MHGHDIMGRMGYNNSNYVEDPPVPVIKRWNHSGYSMAIAQLAQGSVCIAVKEATGKLKAKES
jgi:hypothetical protein